MRIESFSWVSNGSTSTFLIVMGSILGAYILIMVTPLVIQSLRPSYREALRLSRQPGALVKCGCPGRTPSWLFGDHPHLTRNALDTAAAIRTLQAKGCTRVLVIGEDGATTVAPLAPSPLTETERP